MNISTSKTAIPDCENTTKKFRIVFYQRLEQAVDIEAENEAAANEMAQLMLERGEMNPMEGWGKSELDIGGVYEIEKDVAHR